VSSRAFVRLAVASLVVLWLVVVTGGLVRLTASGLGCSSWPLCEEGKLVPSASYHAAIEFGNRVISGVAMLGTILVAGASTRVRGVRRRVRAGAFAAAAGTAAQAPLGAVTVLTDLHPLSVMTHFLLAIAVVAVSIWVAHEAWRLHRGDDAPAAGDPTARAAQVAVVACLVLITTGAFVTAAGPHAGSSDVAIDRLGDLHDAAWVHVRAAMLFTAALLFLCWRAWRVGRGDGRLLAASVGLTLAQLGVGEYQYRNELPWGVVAVHVAIAVTLLTAVVLAACRVVYAAPGAAGGRLGAAAARNGRGVTDQRGGPMGPHPTERPEHRDQYHHTPDEGETRFPPQEGEQGSGEPGHDDPHAALNTPADEVEGVVHNKPPVPDQGQTGNMGRPRGGG
jgi:cytochrome c oxidase assembly protein subunit 15